MYEIEVQMETKSQPIFNTLEHNKLVPWMENGEIEAYMQHFRTQ